MIPLPTPEEQQELLYAIDSHLVRLGALTDRLGEQLDLLADHRHALISAVVLGQ